MEDAFADVGLFVMQSTEPHFGQCYVDVFESEDSKTIADKKKCSILSAQNKIELIREYIIFHRIIETSIYIETLACRKF